MRRVVITGQGIYSSIGKNLEEVTKSLFEGKLKYLNLKCATCKKGNTVGAGDGAQREP